MTPNVQRSTSDLSLLVTFEKRAITIRLNDSSVREFKCAEKFPLKSILSAAGRRHGSTDSARAQHNRNYYSGDYNITELRLSKDLHHG